MWETLLRESDIFITHPCPIGKIFSLKMKLANISHFASDVLKMDILNSLRLIVS